MNSFFPDAISSWNTFITHFNDIPSFARLKDYMNTFLRPNANSVFGIHDPIGLHYIFQLRVSLSPTNHFLLFCPIYIMTRAKLVSSVTNILQKHNLNYLGFVVERSWVTEFFRG